MVGGGGGGGSGGVVKAERRLKYDVGWAECSKASCGAGE